MAITNLLRSVSTTIFLALLLAGGRPAELRGQAMEDVVYLTDGSIIRGVIVEQRPGESILIETRDGNRFRYTMDQIDRMTREVVRGQIPAEGRKSPGVAWAWSFFIPGAGQIYNGDVGAGIVHVGVSAGSYYMMFAADEETAGVAALVYLGNWVWSQVSAYQGAKQSNASLGRLARGSDVRVRVRAIELPGRVRAVRLDVALLSLPLR